MYIGRLYIHSLISIKVWAEPLYVEFHWSTIVLLSEVLTPSLSYHDALEQQSQRPHLPCVLAGLLQQSDFLLQSLDLLLEPLNRVISYIYLNIQYSVLCFERCRNPVSLLPQTTDNAPLDLYLRLQIQSAGNTTVDYWRSHRGREGKRSGPSFSRVIPCSRRPQPTVSRTVSALSVRELLP